MMFTDRQITILEENRYMRDRIDIHRNTDSSCFDALWQICNIYQEVTNRPVDMGCPNCLFEAVLWIYQQLDQSIKAKKETLELLKKTSISALTDEDLLEIHLEESKKIAEQPIIKRKRGQRGKNRI